MSVDGESCEIRIDRLNWNDQAGDMRSRLQTWDWRWKPARRLKRVRIDFRMVDFMEPWALAMFASFANQLRSEGCAVEVLLDESNPSNQYFRQMGLVHLVETGTSTPRWDESNHNTGLHVLASHADVGRFIRSVEALAAGPTRDTLDTLKYGMAELSRNVVQHAQAPAGGVAIAQYFPQRHDIQIAVCDTGRGVFDSLRANYPELRSHLESLKLAVLPHVSGAAAPGPYGAQENAGLGLFFCKEICWRTGGSFWLASHDALLAVVGLQSSGRGRVYRRINEWPGTLVVLHLPDQELVGFDDLFSLCRELAAQSRREVGPAGLDFVDEASELPEGYTSVAVASFLEDVERAALTRKAQILPAIERGDHVVLDFGGARFVTQSFAHALLYEVFKTPGSLTKLVFRGCTRGTEEAIRLVAAYSATYRQLPL
ncbi:MAG: hypothetical protein CHACPFDD_02593 [Phycisphaerae bacterium]|nr:hypothetical protein [Phycisphaerae bacterium]